MVASRDDTMKKSVSKNAGKTGAMLFRSIVRKISVGKINKFWSKSIRLDQRSATISSSVWISFFWMHLTCGFSACQILTLTIVSLRLPISKSVIWETLAFHRVVWGVEVGWIPVRNRVLVDPNQLWPLALRPRLPI